MKRIICACLFLLASGRPLAAERASDRDQREALQHYRSGERALHGEQFNVAEREFQAAVKLDPLLHLAHYGLGQVYMLMKRYPFAVRAFVGARDAFRVGAAEASLDETAYQRQIDDQIRALEDARRALEGTGPRPKVQDLNATLMRVDSQLNQLRSLRRRNPATPQDTPAWISLALGSAYFRASAISDAEREYREAIKVEPKLGEAHNNLAVVLMLTDRYDEADHEIDAAEKAGFRVNAQFKEDLKRRRSG